MFSNGRSDAAKLSDNGFLSGPVVPELLRFSVPILLSLFLQAFYGAFDTWAVGRFSGAADVSAVSTGSQAILIVTGLITGLSMGTTVQLALKMGEKDDAGAARAVMTSVYIFTGLGVLITAVTVAAARPLAVLMNAPEEALEHTVAYIRICGAGGIFIAAYNLISAIFRGMGNSRAPLTFVAIASAVNVVGDVVLIDRLDMGAAGAAIATTFAQAVSVVLSLVFIKKHGLPFPLTKDSFRPHAKTAGRVVALGAPIALQSMCNEFSYMAVLGFVNALGLTISAGVGIAAKLSMFMLLTPTAYMQALSTFVAQNIGARQLERARRAMWDGMLTAAALGAGMSLIGFFGGGVMTSFFIDDAAVIDVSAEFLRASSIESFVLSLAYCFVGYFNGIERTRFVMVQGICAVLLVRIPVAWYMSTRANPVVFNIGLSETLAAAFMLLGCMIYYAAYRARQGDAAIMEAPEAECI